ncbi:MAG: hypothetical protein H6832_13685 [Planctomycetes bacterium]|nr:hypothetical protein [Planctomycetota bacterium]MCB9891293.1 hypothetical protein [Planctomycetota bacterium]MCB9919448.1 hypothetical protein [Planctomycetota bacterium]
MGNKRVTSKSKSGTATAVATPKAKPVAKKPVPKKSTKTSKPAKSSSPAKAAKPAKDASVRAKVNKTTVGKTSVTTKSSKIAAEDTLEQIERMLRGKAGVTSFDTFGCIGESEEDYFVTPAPGETFGRCGGREITSRMEKRVCDKLSDAGVAHCHRPRRYEVKVEDTKMAAYSPCIALRGRGREGKTSILEVMADVDIAHVRKLQAFRRLYEAEFHVTLVLPGHVLDEIERDSFDEAVMPSELGSLVARLAE